MMYFEDIELDSPRESEPYVVSKQELVDFASQWDPQPYHTSEEGARQWGMELFGSSAHSYAILTRLQTMMPGDKPAIVAGLGIEAWRTPNPLRPDCTVRARSHVESKRESNSKPGMGILVSVSQLLDQDDNIILEYKSTGLCMKRPPE